MMVEKPKSTPAGGKQLSDNLKESKVCQLSIVETSGFDKIDLSSCESSQSKSKKGEWHMEENNQSSNEGKTSAWQAGWNVTNAIQGMSLVSLPYAVLHGGYWGLFSILFVAYICCYTGKILIDCLYDHDPKTGQIVRVRNSFIEIGQACLGKRLGGRAVYVSQLIEIMMTGTLYIVLCGHLVVGLYPILDNIGLRGWMIICSLFLIPCAFLKNMQSVSVLSFWCAIVHTIINIIIMGYCCLRIKDWYWSQVTFSVNLETFPVCLGIVVFSYTSHAFLSCIEASMEEPRQFNTMFDWSHVAAALSKFAFAYICFLGFGNDTEEVITNNISSRNMRTFVNMTLIAKALLTYPLAYYSAVDMLELSLFKQNPTVENPEGVGKQRFKALKTPDGNQRPISYMLRVSLVLITIIAAVTIPHFALLVGFVGSFNGTMLAFVWPCVFHMYLRWDSLGIGTVVWEITIIVLGIFFGIAGMYSSLMGLVIVTFGMEADID